MCKRKNRTHNYHILPPRNSYHEVLTVYFSSSFSLYCYPLKGVGWGGRNTVFVTCFFIFITNHNPLCMH